ncbi:hypothetical protein OG21DRAFT_151137 [Imleria badia]|nr:hypothetical protein OG21DRAFT_151137 [Imleria badia]
MNVGLDSTAGNITQNERQHPSTATNYMMSEDESRRKPEAISEKLDKILCFLDALDCTTKQKDTSLLRQLDTCTWLFSTGEYKSWRDTSDSFLLLHGKAGAGKTVLASAAIQDLLETKHKEEFLAYFYCDFRTGRSTSAVEVMRSVVAQLVASLCAVMVDPEDLLDDLLKDTNNRAELFYNVKGLSRYLSKIAKLCPRKPLIVIDALDECREVETLLDGLIITGGDVRTFVTSRPHQNIVSMLSHFPSISMDRMANELSSDILLHVTNELDSCCRLRTFGDSLKVSLGTMSD